MKWGTLAGIINSLLAILIFRSRSYRGVRNFRTLVFCYSINRKENTGMSKFRTLMGLAVIVGMFAISAAPASAWFQSAGTATQGVGSAGSTTFGDEEAAVTCEKAEGGWRIDEFTKQAATTLGQHQLISVSKWNNCTAFGFLGAEVTPCQLQLIQTAKGQTTGVLGTVITGCTVTVKGQCQIKVAPAGNSNLKEIKLANSGANLVGTVNVSGITSTATSLGGFGCTGITNLTNKVGTEKGVVTGVGLKEV